jgi:hypothetical protein
VKGQRIMFFDTFTRILWIHVLILTI